MERDWSDFKALNGGIEGARAAFEVACEALIRNMYKSKNVQIVRANPGDEGIDIFVGEIGIEPIKIFQCKFFLEQISDSQQSQIRDSFKTAKGSSKFEIEEWILCIPKTMDIDENKWWSGWKSKTIKKHNISIALKNGNELISLMRYYEIYNSIFKINEAIKIDDIVKGVNEIKARIENTSIKLNTPLQYLSQQLKEWFNVLSYNFEDYEEKTDLIFSCIINIPVRRKRYDRVFVVGVCEEVELRHISNLRGKVSINACDEGWIISTRRISQAARDEVMKDDSGSLSCYTFDELLDEDANFTGYINWLEEQITIKGIDKKYIPLACKKDEFDQNTKLKIGESRYNSKNGWIDGYLDRWQSDPAKKHISILGEFGTGKTWFALHYAWERLQEYKKAKERGINRPRLPIYIPLRDYAKAVTVESLFSEFFFRKHEIPLPGYSAFEQLNKMGKLLLVFDGFDEMASKVDRQKMINNFWQIASVAKGDTKIILTCRNEHFPEAKEGRSLLNAELKASTSNLTGEPPQFEVLELLRFDNNQIKNIFMLNTTQKTVEKIMSNKELLDLARRPVMTELILEALPEIESGKPIDMSRIYLYAVTRKMQRDIKDERTFTSLADKLYFMCEISWEMLSTDNMSLNYRMFPDRIKELFGEKITEQKDLDHWHYDMMGQTMLIRNEDGDYMPAHRSLLEFFVAYKFAAELGIIANEFIEILNCNYQIDTKVQATGEYRWSNYFCKAHLSGGTSTISNFRGEDITYLSDNIGKVPITKAILDLLINMVPINNIEIQERLLENLNLCKGKSFEEVGYLATNIVIILLKYKPDYFRNKDLSDLCLKRINDLILPRFHEGKIIDFTNTCFSNSDMNDLELHIPILENSDFRGCNLSEANFGKYQYDDLASHPYENIVAISSHDDIILYDLDTNLMKKRVRDTGAWHIKFILEGKYLIISGWGGFKIRDGSTLELLSQNELSYIKNKKDDQLNNLWTTAFELLKDNKTLVIGSNNSNIYLWDFENSREAQVLKGHKSHILSISFSHDEKYMLSASSSEIILWEFELLKPIFTIKTGFYRYSIKFHPLENIFTMIKDNDLKFFDAISFRVIGQLSLGKIKSVSFSNDGSLIAIVVENEIQIFDYKQKSLTNKIKCKISIIHLTGICFNLTGSIIYLTTKDGVFCGIDVVTGNQVCYLEHLPNVLGANFLGATGLTRDLAIQLKNNGAIVDSDYFKPV